MPKVSVIIPIYNTAKYLEECLDSVTSQTLNDIEVILINDGSSDNSEEICLKYKEKYPNIIYISQKNKGEATSRNVGLNSATGKYLTFVDSDDKISANSIKTSYKIAEESNSDIVITSLNIHNHYSKLVEDFSWVCSAQMFLKRSFLESHPKIKFISELKSGPDAIFSHEILAITDRIAKNPHAVYFYRRHDSQISHNTEAIAEKLLYNMRIWFKELEEFYTKNNLWKKNETKLMSFLSEHVIYHYLHTKWNKEQKQEIFELSHNFIKKNQLNINTLKVNNLTKWTYLQFLKSNKYQDFEFLLFLSHFNIKFKACIRKFKNKGQYL